MTSDDASRMIQHVLRDFGLRGATVEHLDSIDHCNVRVNAETGAYFLKILASECSESPLRSRLQFLDFLREGGLPIAAAIHTTTGQPFSRVTIDGRERLATLSRWIDGQTLRDRTDEQWIESCGELLARLHVRSREFDPPSGFEATVWDEVCAPPAEGWLQEFLADAPLDQHAREVIDRTVTRTRTVRDRLPRDRSHYGLIHADFHGGNLIFDGRTIWIVDLDDAGWGYFLFDVAWPAMLFSKRHPDTGAFLEPFLRGYERLRPLANIERRLLPEILLTAGIGALEMVHASQIANDAPLAKEWLSAIVEWLESHLAEIEIRKATA